MKLLTPFAFVAPTRTYLSFISEAFDVIKFSNNYMKKEIPYFEVRNTPNRWLPVSPNGDNDNATEQFKLGLVMDCS
jgi:hypothetical protein